ncbi:MAG: 23S rRNA (pseudouridine(1915)-N(3))-methyltransferase RlmH [Clostridiales bacterium]|nr:23S rRNA (pseudouridine(1915)-N(3))-methyltransferase RlmH [Clostridiales bacterium]
MKLRIVCAGKIKEKWLSDGIAEYRKRLSKYTSVEIIEVADAPDTTPVSQALEQEGRRMLDRIHPSAYVIVLDLHGREMTSEEWSEHVMTGFEKGGAELVLLIGGSNGLSEEVCARANERLCLSPMTFTHQMTRLIILEQVYRAFKIRNEEKYHK